MGRSVIVDAVRTPIGRFQGALRNLRPEELYARAINALLERSKVQPQLIQDVITGCVTQCGEQGADIGKIAALLSNLPKSTAGVTLNRMCGSSQTAIHFASQAVEAGDAQFMVAGGVESMSRSPMFSDIGGTLEIVSPPLRRKYEIVHQGESAERVADLYKLAREELDRFSFESHMRAASATKSGFFKSQIVPIENLEYDEGIRFTPDIGKMAQLNPVFRRDGKITAANSSQISDGAAAVLIADEAAAAAAGLPTRARFVARVTAADDPTLQLLGIIPATRMALEKAGLSLKEIDVVEINEAFAAVVLAWVREFGADVERLNPNGGAIAHGHPLGATGAILMTKLLNELERRNGRFGLQVMCIGFGMATATIIERA